MFIYDVKETMIVFAIMHNNTTKREQTIHKMKNCPHY